MELFCRELGKGSTTIVIVHGLYGASDNWLSVAAQLEDRFRVLLVDQRNHGQSPHAEEHSYDLMAADLYETIRSKTNEPVVLLGHSMGGKTAMRMALEHPESVQKLIVADIAPKNYWTFANYAETTANHEKILDALLQLKPEEANNREELEAALKKDFPSRTLRLFLLKNVKRNKAGRYQWQINLPVLRRNLPELMDGFSHLPKPATDHNPEAIFIRGALSPYIKDEDTLVINQFFPGAQLVTVPKAGHWLHAEQPELFLKTLLYYLE